MLHIDRLMIRVSSCRLRELLLYLLGLVWILTMNTLFDNSLITLKFHFLEFIHGGWIQTWLLEFADFGLLLGWWVFWFTFVCILGSFLVFGRCLDFYLDHISLHFGWALNVSCPHSTISISSNLTWLCSCIYLFISQIYLILLSIRVILLNHATFIAYSHLIRVFIC